MLFSDVQFNSHTLYRFIARTQPIISRHHQICKAEARDQIHTHAAYRQFGSTRRVRVHCKRRTESNASAYQIFAEVEDTPTASDRNHISHRPLESLHTEIEDSRQLILYSACLYVFACERTKIVACAMDEFGCCHATAQRSSFRGIRIQTKEFLA